MTRRRHPRRLAAVITLAATFFSAAALSHAQQEGPIVFGEKKKTEWLSLQNTYGDVEVLYQYQNNSIDPNNGPKQTFSQSEFQETLTLGGVGSIYHPNLIELDPLEGTFGLTQTDVDNNGQGDYQNGTLYEWDVAATFLRKEDYVPTLYTRRTTQLVNRTFGPTLDSTITQTGAILDIRKKPIPTRLEIYRSEQQQTSDATDDTSDDFDLTQDAFVWHSEYRPHERQVFNWDFTYNKIDQSTGDITSKFDTYDATLNHSIDFGAKGQHNLTSNLHYFNQTGDFASEEFRWDELLRLRHTDTFETRYQYTFDQNSFSGIDQMQNLGTVGFTHKLYKSLVTNGNIGLEDIQRSDGGDSQRIFGDLDFNYVKKVPLGRLSSSAGVGYSHEVNDATNQPTPVVNEPHTFVDGIPVILSGDNIDPNSIVITDAAGIIVYVNGLDYTITVLPTAVEINRVIGGRISAGQTVLIDYLLLPQAANTTDTLFYYASLRYDIDQGPLRGLGVYGRFSQQNQTIQSDAPTTFVENDFTDFVVGTDYRFWFMQVGAEQQWHDSTIVPFNATRFFARYNAPLGANTALTLNANYDIIDYPDEDNHVEVWIVSGRIEHRFTRRLWGYASVLYRDEQNEAQGDSQGWEEQVELQWRYRQTYIYGLLRNSNLDTDFQNNSFQFLEIGLRREF